MKRVGDGRGTSGSLRVACAAVVPLLLAAVSPAQAQDPLSRFLDGIFQQERAAPPPVAPQQGLPASPSATPPSPPARGGAQPQAVPAPAAQPAPLSSPASALAPVQARAHPMPPARPPGIGGVAASPVSAPAAAVPGAAASAAQTARAPQQAAMPRNANEAVARVNAYLNGINTLTARFLQTGADRQQVGGTLFVQRPGRLRFAYDPPSTLEIVADGRSVAVRDSRLRTNDVYSIGQTPLKFLLRDNVNLARDVQVRDVQIDPGGLIAISLEDTATLGGTSRVTLRFDARADVLLGWQIIDPQGYETDVTLSGVEVARR